MMKLFRSRLVLAALLLAAMPTFTFAAPKAGVPVPAAAAAAAGKIDINTATKDELMAFNGIGDKYSDKIIAGRPYARKDQLLSKNILPEATYKKIEAQVIASQPK